MGLDQSFYDKKPSIDSNGYADFENSIELAYFRKHQNLHRFIESVIGETVGNAEIVRLGSVEINDVIHFLLNDKTYWAYPENVNESDHFFAGIGRLMYHVIENKPIYYQGDW
jgi:hypothetical protein